jgi:hypothetical protein
MRLRACLANVLRACGVISAEPFDRALGPLCVGASLIPDRLQLGERDP